MVCLINLLFVLIAYKYKFSLEENSIFEMFQVFLLFISMLCFLYACFSCDFKSVAFISAVFCLTFILRELDVEDFDIHNAVIILFSGTGRNILLGSLFCLAAYFIKRSHKLSDIIKNVLFPFMKGLILCGMFFTLSWVFDKNIVHINQNMLFEELAEINAYLLILILSIIYNIRYRIS